MKNLIKILLAPISLIYGIIVHFRNKFFDWNIFKSTSFSFPVIVVGNLSVGGTGKTPHIEYLINLLSNSYSICTLSRGYKRKTSGFVLAKENSSINDIGDEPLQYHKKFKHINVAVCEDRVNGVNSILEKLPDTDAILLDDAFQHRKLKAGLNILITDFNSLYTNDYLMPSGRLRESKKSSKRADIIIISKSPENLSSSEKKDVLNKISPQNNQSVYFSSIQYNRIVPFTDLAKDLSSNTNPDVLLVSGIANPSPLKKHLLDSFNSVNHISFPDHHNFTKTDIEKIKNSFQKISGNNKIVITTEKDIMRLSLPEIFTLVNDIPIFYIPINVCFSKGEQNEFDKKILDYVKTNRGN